MTQKVLLADDEEGILALLAATLGNEGWYEVLLARDGDEALEIARREKPALVFLDVRMPKRDGHEVCRALKEDPNTAQIRVIMLTALTQEFDRQEAADAGADDYFVKPFSPMALLQKVEEVLAQR